MSEYFPKPTNLSLMEIAPVIELDGTDFTPGNEECYVDEPLSVGHTNRVHRFTSNTTLAGGAEINGLGMVMPAGTPDFEDQIILNMAITGVLSGQNIPTIWAAVIEAHRVQETKNYAIQDWYHILEGQDHHLRTGTDNDRHSFSYEHTAVINNAHAVEPLVLALVFKHGATSQIFSDSFVGFNFDVWAVTQDIYNPVG